MVHSSTWCTAVTSPSSLTVTALTHPTAGQTTSVRPQAVSCMTATMNTTAERKIPQFDLIAPV